MNTLLHKVFSNPLNEYCCSNDGSTSCSVSYEDDLDEGLCSLCDKHHPDMKMYTCNICYCSFGDKCVGDNQDILKNPIMHNGHFYCGDEATDCYISQEEAQSVLGDADIVRFFVQCSGCGEYEFLSLAEKQAQLCPTCNVCYSCNDCRVESLDEEYYPTWKCLKCTHVAHLKEAEYEFNRRWNDYL